MEESIVGFIGVIRIKKGENFCVPIKPFAVGTEGEVCNRRHKILSHQQYTSKPVCFVVGLIGVIKIKKIKRKLSRLSNLLLLAPLGVGAQAIRIGAPIFSAYRA